MRQCRWLTAILALGLSGCVLRGKQQAKLPAVPAPAPQPAGRVAASPAPRPEPLSIPQTQAQLPPAQPIDPQALATVQPPVQPVEAPATPRPRPRPAGQHAPAPARPEPPAPVAATPAATQATAPQPAPPAEGEPRGQVLQEILPPEELKRLQDSVAARKQDVHRVLDPALTRKLNAQQAAAISRIQSFLTQSEEAEKRGDWRQADTLGERAQILARELQGGGR
jgi:hypothetical protein